MTLTTTNIPAGTWLDVACHQSRLIFIKDGRDYQLTNTVPYHYRNESGGVVETQAIVLSVDNGNDALKASVIDAYGPFLRSQRIVTAYAPAPVVRAGDKPVSFKVGNSKEFLIGDDALASRDIEDLPIGLTEERLTHDRFRHYFCAACVEALACANYSPTGTMGEHHIYLQFGMPNEEISVGGIKAEAAAALQTILNKRIAVQRIGSDNAVATWNIRFIEINPFPQSLGSFFAWYYRIDGSSIDTDILRFVSLDFGGGHLHQSNIDLIYKPGAKRPSVRMGGELIGGGTKAMAQDLQRTIREKRKTSLELVECRQALITRHAPINGRNRSVADLIDEIVAEHAQKVFVKISETIQESRNYLMFTGGGSVLLQQSLYALVSKRRSSDDFLFAPAEVASLLNSIGGLPAAFAAARLAQEKWNHARANR
jgi:hypothetical protein